MMGYIIRLLSITGLVVSVPVFTTGLALADPVAIVETVEAANATVTDMDYVEVGDVIVLARGDRLVLGYFESCVQETIIGGNVIVGKMESQVSGGDVTRITVACDGGGVQLTDKQKQSSGIMTFRGNRAAASHGAPRPKVKLYGLSPVLRANVGGNLSLTRIDKPAPAIKVTTIAGGTDLATRDITLAPGAIYRAELDTIKGQRSIVFEIDARAEPGTGPIVSRLLRL